MEWKTAMIQYLYLGRVDYDQGLRLQAEIAVLRYQGGVQNVLLLLEHPPVLTLGRNAKRSNVLASDELLARRGVIVREIDRGGDVTYHGPGQLVGYPIFDLRSLHDSSGKRMGPVEFVRRIEEALIRLCGVFGAHAGRISGLTGVWCPADGEPISEGCGENPPSLQAIGRERKIGAIGIHVARGITTHGFAFNVTTDLADFALINPCGITGCAVTSLENEIRLQKIERPEPMPSLELVAHQAARQFGRVFNEQVLAVENVAALRAQAETAPADAPQFPAEDTPLRIPWEVERLRHPGGHSSNA
jgi:lipoyl(octanoyl) transferase